MIKLFPPHPAPVMVRMRGLQVHGKRLSGIAAGLIVPLAIAGAPRISPIASARVTSTPLTTKESITRIQTAGQTMRPHWRSTKLGKILVIGRRIRIPKPIVFEIIKAALKRPWSTSYRDRNQVVCRFRYNLGSHIRDRAVLYCQTNNEHFQREARHFFSNYDVPGKKTILGPVEFQEFQTDQLHLVDPNRFKRLFAKLPPANSRYTLEVTQHGHPVSEWFMDRGQLLKVIYFKKRPSSSVGTGPHAH